MPAATRQPCRVSWSARVSLPFAVVSAARRGLASRRSRQKAGVRCHLTFVDRAMGTDQEGDVAPMKRVEHGMTKATREHLLADEPATNQQRDDDQAKVGDRVGEVRAQDCGPSRRLLPFGREPCRLALAAPRWVHPRELRCLCLLQALRGRR